MKISLKNIKHIKSLSEETEAFTADLYIDGILVGTANNRGHGGSTDYLPYEGKRGFIANAEKYCESLPEITANFGDKSFTYKQSLETVIDSIVNDFIERKVENDFENKIRKAMLTGIVVGVKGAGSYAVYKLPKGQTIAGLDKAKLQDLVRGVKFKLKNGESILNTNI
ncbi:MAG: hypothetical protein IM618_10970 [Cytophagales bacterium]|nr:hypothetical protein [Cytophagales bacterium]